MGRKNYQLGAKTAFLKKRDGLSLTEILVVLAILAILILLFVFTLRPFFQISKSRDSQRETDLRKISVALDGYADSNKGPCYPDDIYAVNILAPDYIKTVPRDPQTKVQYAYETFDCNKYVIYATLETKNAGLLYTRNTGKSGNYVVTSTNYRMNSQEAEETIPEFRSYYGCWNCQCRLISKWLPPGCNTTYDNANCNNNQCTDEATGACKNNYECPEQF